MVEYNPHAQTLSWNSVCRTKKLTKQKIHIKRTTISGLIIYDFNLCDSNLLIAVWIIARYYPRKLTPPSTRKKSTPYHLPAGAPQGAHLHSPALAPGASVRQVQVSQRDQSSRRSIIAHPQLNAESPLNPKDRGGSRIHLSIHLPAAKLCIFVILTRYAQI